MRWLAILLVFLAGCSAQDRDTEFGTPAERVVAKDAFEAVRANDLTKIRAMAQDGLRAELDPAVFAQMHSYLPAGDPELESVQINVANTNGTSVTYKTFSYEVGSGDRWALIDISLEQVGGKILLAGLNVTPPTATPIAANSFTMKGKHLAHWLWIVAMLGALTITLMALVQIVRTPGLRYKWLWAIGSLFSVMGFSLNWTTGNWNVWPLNILFLGIGADKGGPLTPWVFSFGVPVVALAFLLLRDRLAGPRAC